MKSWVAVLIVSAMASSATAGQMLARTWRTDVSLVTNGKARCAIVYPDGIDGYLTLAQNLADALRSLGVPDFPLVPDTHAVPQRLGTIRDDLQDLSLIILGDINTNRALFRLYANHYCSCDAVYPGSEGFVLRTIVRPFGRNANWIIVGASSRQGAEQGVERLKEVLSSPQIRNTLILPYVLEVRLGQEMKRILDLLIPSADHSKDAESQPVQRTYALSLDRFTTNSHLHYYTGLEVFATRARDAILRLADHDPDGVRIADYTMENLAVAWRRLSTCPVITDSDGQRIDELLRRTAVQQEQSWWRLEDASCGIGGRHQTTGMLALWTLIRVLMETGHPDDEARRELTQWRQECESYLSGLTRHYWDDQDDYQSADSVQNTVSFCLQTGRLTWFENGLARKAAQRLLAITDNRGWYAGIQGYGEALPGWEHFTLNGGLLIGACRFVYDDNRFATLTVRFPPLKKSWGALQPWGLNQYAAEPATSAPLPDWLTGLQAIRFTPYRLERINAGDFLTTRLTDQSHPRNLKANGLSADEAFDKLVIRPDVDANGMYLLLQGTSASALTTFDMNAIVRYTDLGKIWLLHNTDRRSLFFKNAVYISNGANTDPLPASCELVAHGAFPGALLASSRLPDYRGTTWTRNLITVPERFTIVIDQVRFRRPGQYHVCCTWRTPGYASLTDSAWESRQDEVTFRLVPSSMQGATSRREQQRDGATRPTVLRQIRTTTAAAGDQIAIENVLYTSGSQRTQRCEVRRVAPGAVVVRHETDAGNESFYLAAASDEGIDLERFASDAAVVLLSPDEVWQIGGTGIRLGNDPTTVKGHIKLTARAAETASSLLQQLWADAERPGKPRAADWPREQRAFVTPASTSRVLEGKGCLLDGIQWIPTRNAYGSDLYATDRILPVLLAEPRLSPQRGSGMAFSRRSSDPTNTIADTGDEILFEPVLKPTENAEFTLRLPEPVRLTELSLFGAPRGKPPSALPPGKLKVRLAFSTDGFHTDRRTRVVNLTVEPTYHNLYKGHSYIFECYRAAELDEMASEIRVTVQEATCPELLLTDVQLRGEQTRGTRPIQLLLSDLDGDQKDEIVAWSNDGEMAVLHSDNTVIWQKAWPAGLLAVDTWDLDGDSLQEILLSTSDCRVHVLNQDGSLRWEKDFSDMYRRTDELFFRDGCAIFGMAKWPLDTENGADVLLTSYFGGVRLDKNGDLQNCFKRTGRFTRIRPVSAGSSRKPGLAIWSDIPWAGPGQLEWWTPEKQVPDETARVPNGAPVFFDVDDYDKDGRPEALVATEQGIGLYSPSAPGPRWEHMTEAPVAGVDTVSQYGHPNAVVFVYGRGDGFICAVDSQGTVLHNVFLDEPIRCLTAVESAGSPSVLLVGTDQSLRCLNAEDFAERWRQPGRFQHIDTMDVAGQNRAIAATVDGELQMFEAQALITH